MNGSGRRESRSEPSRPNTRNVQGFRKRGPKMPGQEGRSKLPGNCERELTMKESCRYRFCCMLLIFNGKGGKRAERIHEGPEW